MGIYKPRGDTIEAQQVSVDNVDTLVNWCGGMKVDEINPRDTDDVYVGINVPSVRSGTFRVSQGDYLCRSSRGEFFRLSASDLQLKYDLV